MKLTKQQQNGLLFVLYVARAGRCKVSDAAAELDLSEAFLEQIARKLRIAGLVKSHRGPGGGFELVGEPTIGQVIVGLGKMVPNPYRASKSSEKRALGQLMASFNNAMTPILRRKVQSLNLELAANESAAMSGLSDATVN